MKNFTSKATTVIFIWTLFALSCGPLNEKRLENVEDTADKSFPEYAKLFSIEYKGNAKIVTLKESSKNSGTERTYFLIPKGSSLPSSPDNATVIEIPIEETVCFSTTNIPFLEMLGMHETLVGFPQTDLISSPLTRKRIDNGLVKDIGPDTGFNPEVLLDLSPEIVFAYSMGHNQTKYEVLEGAGIPVIFNTDYLEEHPLGRAEWIRLIAAFYNKEKQADSIFNHIKAEYLRLQSLTKDIKEKPTVFSGNLYGDIWYMPGGKSWPATFINDAGGEFLWKNNGSSGSIELSFEVVLENALEGDFWINAGSFKSLTEIKNMDFRYSKFGAFQNKKIYNYYAKSGPKGGSIYLELGYARPDIILADLIKILHPEILPGHELFFYDQLN